MADTRTIRIEEGVYQKIKALSEKHNITLSAVITFLYDTKIDDTKTEIEIIGASK
ncbi:MAG: hypothetical protein PH343_08005 [Nitrospira sp.]|nr:hypothetical protein [Nitrospira sp.]